MSGAEEMQDLLCEYSPLNSVHIQTGKHKTGQKRSKMKAVYVSTLFKKE